jgi:hypothetical protein
MWCKVFCCVVESWGVLRFCCVAFCCGCRILFCFVLFCLVLFRFALLCFALFCFDLFCLVLCCVVLSGLIYYLFFCVVLIFFLLELGRGCRNFGCVSLGVGYRVLCSKKEPETRQDKTGAGKTRQNETKLTLTVNLLHPTPKRYRASYCRTNHRCRVCAVCLQRTK